LDALRPAFGRLAIDEEFRHHQPAPSVTGWNASKALRGQILPPRAEPRGLTGTTVDPQIPDQPCCTSEIVRVVPILVVSGRSKVRHQRVSRDAANVSALSRNITAACRGWRVLH
jgi:hypothetical protein